MRLKDYDYFNDILLLAVILCISYHIVTIYQWMIYVLYGIGLNSFF